MRGKILLAWSLLGGLVAAEPDRPVGDDPQDEIAGWAKSLSREFGSIPDRVMVVEFSKPGRDPIEYHLAISRTEGCAALRGVQGGEFWFAMGWFEPPAGGEQCAYLIGREGGSRIGGWGEFLRRARVLDRLLGKSSPLDLDLFGVSVYLSRDDITAGIGVGASGTAESAPWLQSDLLIRATGVEELEKEIVFHFPEDGRLVVGKDGMLKEQVYPVEGVVRTMRLKSWEPMEEWSREKYFGSFEGVEIVESELPLMRELIRLAQTHFSLRALKTIRGGVDENTRERERDPLRAEMLGAYEYLCEELVVREGKLRQARDRMRQGMEAYWMRAKEQKLEGFEALTFEEYIAGQDVDAVVQGAMSTPTWDQLAGPWIPGVFAEEWREVLVEENEEFTLWFESLGRVCFSEALARAVVKGAFAGEGLR